MTRRTDERLEFAKAKENSWRKFRERKEEDVMEEDEEQAWKSLKRGILELEEEGGCWKEPAKETRNIMVTNNQSGVVSMVGVWGKEEVTKSVKSQEDPHGGVSQEHDHGINLKTGKKRQHSGTFNYKNIDTTKNKVRSMVDIFEGWEKEPGVMGD